MDKSKRLQDDPVIQSISGDVKEIKTDQKKILNYLLDPKEGVFKRIDHLETWRNETIDPERIAIKKWGWKIFWAIIFVLLTGGSVLGIKLGL